MWRLLLDQDSYRIPRRLPLALKNSGAFNQSKHTTSAVSKARYPYFLSFCASSKASYSISSRYHNSFALDIQQYLFHKWSSEFVAKEYIWDDPIGSKAGLIIFKLTTEHENKLIWLTLDFRSLSISLNNSNALSDIPVVPHAGFSARNGIFVINASGKRADQKSRTASRFSRPSFVLCTMTSLSNISALRKQHFFV